MKTQQELKSKVELFLRDALRCSDAQKKMLQGTRTSTTFGTRSSKSFAIWLQIPHFSSLRTFRQVLNLGLLTQSHKIGLEGIFFGQCCCFHCFNSKSHLDWRKEAKKRLFHINNPSLLYQKTEQKYSWWNRQNPLALRQKIIIKWVSREVSESQTLTEAALRMTPSKESRIVNFYTHYYSMCVLQCICNKGCFRVGPICKIVLVLS